MNYVYICTVHWKMETNNSNSIITVVSVWDSWEVFFLCVKGTSWSLWGEKCSQCLMRATETVNSWQNTRKLVVSECLTTTHSNHLSHTSSGKKNQKCLFWKCKLLFFIYSQSRSWVCFLHHVCMEIWCLFNCFRKTLWRLGNLQSPSKISLKSLFSIAKGKEEWMRTHRAQFNKCLKVMSCPCCWICCWICCWHVNGTGKK